MRPVEVANAIRIGGSFSVVFVHIYDYAGELVNPDYKATQGLIQDMVERGASH